MLQPDKSYIVQRRGIRLRRAGVQRRVTVCRRTGAFLRFLSQKISLYLTSYDNTATVYLIFQQGMHIYIYIRNFIYIYHSLVKHAFHRFLRFNLMFIAPFILKLLCSLYIRVIYTKPESHEMAGKRKFLDAFDALNNTSRFKTPWLRFFLLVFFFFFFNPPIHIYTYR